MTKRLLTILFLASTINLFGQAHTFKWVKKIPLVISKLCTDNDDNIYIAGLLHGTKTFENYTLTSNGDNNEQDIVIAKFDSTGSLLWYKQFGGPEQDGCSNIEVDQNNDLIVTNYFDYQTIYYGDTIATTGYGAIITKLSKNGDLIWCKVPGYNNNGCFHAYSADVDINNNILISGNIEYGSGIFSDTIIPSNGHIVPFIAKYNSDGDFEWVRSFNNGVFQHTFDIAGNVIVISDSIRKLSPIGNLIWTKPKAVSIFNLHDYHCLEADSLMSFYIVSNFKDTLVIGIDSFISRGSNDMILLKYDSLGNFIWGVSGGGPKGDGASLISVKSNKIIIKGGFTSEFHINSDSLFDTTLYWSRPFIAEFNLEGNLIFIKKIGTKKNPTIERLSAGKSIYFSGYLSDTTYFDDIVITNDNIWSQSYFLARLQDEIYKTVEYTETFEIYPNPTFNTFTIHFNPDYKNVNLEIYDLQGRLVRSNVLNANDSEVDIGFISKGIYIVILKTDDKITSGKIVKL